MLKGTSVQSASQGIDRHACRSPGHLPDRAYHDLAKAVRPVRRTVEVVRLFDPLSTHDVIDSGGTRNTSGSEAPSGITSEALRKSIDGSLRPTPLPIPEGCTKTAEQFSVEVIPSFDG